MTQLKRKFDLLRLCCLCLLLGACSEEPQALSTTETAAAVADSAQQGTRKDPDDLIAQVGDQLITFSEINTMMNSSAIASISGDSRRTG